MCVGGGQAGRKPSLSAAHLVDSVANDRISILVTAMAPEQDVVV